MGQMGFFDLGNRYTGLDAKNEPLLKIDGVVPWEDLRARLEAVWRRADKVRKSRAGRKPWDAIVMFKTIILCALYNLSDDQVEHQIRDRLSFMRFLGLGLEGRVPDAKTVWLYREQLTQAGVIEALFETFDGYLKDQGYLDGRSTPRGGPEQPQENARIKARRLDCGGTKNHGGQTAQQPRGERADKGGRDAGRLGGQAGKAAPKGCRGAVDQEARQEPLRLQEPCQRGPSAQAGAALSCERRGGARQPSPRRYPGWGQHGFGCVGGQRLPLGGDRGVAEGEGVAEPDPSQGPPQQAAERAREARQQDPFVGSGPRRACLRGPEQRHGRDAGA